MYKKFLLIVFSIIVAVSVALTGTAATNENDEPPEFYVPVDVADETATVIVSDVSGKIGEEVSVDVVMENNPGIAAFRFFIDFDETYLEPVSVSKGAAVSAGNIYSNVSLEDISVVITTWDNASDVSMNGVVFTMVFKIKDTSGLTDYPLTLTYNQVDVCNENFEDVYFEVVDGSITVNGFNVFTDGATEIEAGETLHMLVSLSENNALRNEILWSSDNESVAVVDENGVVTGVGGGKATITATVAGTSCTASCEISVVEPVVLSGISVNTMPQKTSYYIGGTFESDGLTLTAEYSDGSVETIESGFTCSPSVFESEGEQTVTVTYEGMIAEFTVTVERLYYTVNWVVDDVTTSVEYKAGETIAIPEPPEKEGYTFVGWTPQIPETMPEEDLTFIAIWTANIYEVIFDADGGTFPDGETQKTVQVAYGSEILFEDVPTKYGYDFTGWVDETGKFFLPSSLGTLDIANSKAFKAEWIELMEIEYEVLTDVMSSDGSRYTLTREVYYSYLGETVYADYEVPEGFVLNEEESVLSGEVTSDGLVLRVVIDRKQYTLTTVVDGKTTSTVYYYGQDIVQPEDPEKEGSTFIGWTPEIPETMPAYDCEFTAVFKENISIVPAEGSTTVIDYNDKIIYGLSERVRESNLDEYITVIGDGYYEVTFYKYNIVGTGSAISLYDSTTDELIDTYYVIIFGDLGSDSHISASDSEIAFSEADGITSWSDKTSDEYNPYIVKAADMNGDGIVNHIDAAVINNSVLGYVTIDQTTGTWDDRNADAFSLYFYTDNTLRKLHDNHFYAYGETINLPENPEKEGYVFLGWYDYETGESISKTMPDKNIFVYASWEKDNLITGACGDNLTYTFNKATGELVISGTGDMYDYNFSTDVPWYDYCSDIKSVVIGDDVTSIGDYAFNCCDSITSVTIPDSVTSIGYGAFFDCDSLTSIKIGRGVTVINSNPFSGCDSLTDITVDPDNTAFSSDEYGVLFNKDKTRLFLYPMGNKRTSYTIPDSVTNTNPEAFKDCTGLTNVTIGNGITGIEVYTFSGCTGLTSVTIGNSVTTIYHQAFHDCTALTDVYYNGTSEEWSAIKIQSDNTCLTSATVHFKYYTVTLNANGGSFCDGSEEFIVKVESGKAIEAETPVREYYNFAGWADAEGNTVTIPETMPENDLTFYALWKEEPVEFKIVSGSELEIVDISYVYDMNEKYVIANVGENITIDELFAEVEVVGNGYISVTPSVDDKIGTGAIVSLYDNNTMSLVAEYYIVVSGDVDGDGACTGYDAKIISANESDIGDWVSEGKGHIYYAADVNKDFIIDFVDIEELGFKRYGLQIFEMDSEGEYQLTADYTDYEQIQSCEDVPFFGLVGETVSYVPESKEDYFLDTEKSVLSGTITDGYEMLVLTVYYSRNKYLFTTDIDGETVTVEYYFGQSINKPADPTKDGYTFVGWSDADGNAVNVPDVMPDENLTFIATWVEDEPEHVHIPQTITIDATCTVDGMEYTICMECGETIGEATVIPALNHSETETVTIDAECTFDGMQYDICVFCGEIIGDTVIIPALGHKPGEWEIMIPATCTMDGDKIKVCTVCGETVETGIIEAPGHKAGEWEVKTPATCTVNGEKIKTCIACFETLETGVIEKLGHTPADEWTVVLKPTVDTEGKRIIKCTVCGATVEEDAISKLEVAHHEDTDISIVYQPEDYNSEVSINVEEIFDGGAFNVVNTQTGSAKSQIFDITMTVNGVETQPKGKVTVRIPLPEGYNPNRSFVYHVDTKTGKVEKMNSRHENGYLVFETDHFSYYAVVDESQVGSTVNVTVSIKNPSTTTISYGDSIILHAVVDGDLPKDAKIVWTADNANFTIVKTSDDGMTCTVTPASNGDTVFTATLVDADGNEISSDTQKMTSKAGFFQKIIAFFKKLFGLTKVIPEAIKEVF